MAKQREPTKSSILVQQILNRIEEDRERALKLFEDIEAQREDNKDLVLLNGRLWTDTITTLQNTTTLQINAVKLLQKEELTQMMLDARTVMIDEQSKREQDELAKQLEESARFIDVTTATPVQRVSTIVPLDIPPPIAAPVIDIEFDDDDRRDA
jgi:hypothetical protein